MFVFRGANAVLTGASRGIGPYLARRLAAEGVNLTLVARDRAALEKLASELTGIETRVVAVDLSDPASIAVIEAEALGPVDLLVNNAGVETFSHFERFPPEEIQRAVAVNLTTPMLLTRAFLPGMLERKRGYIVNMSSLAGVIGSAYTEVYNATKHGLVGFTRGLRSSLADSEVGATVLCPGFVSDVGMYVNMKAEAEKFAPKTVGTVTPQAVAEAMIRAIQNDEPDVLIAGGPPLRPILALQTLTPKLAEWIAKKLGTNDVMAPVADSRHK